MDKKKLQQILIIMPIALSAGIWAYLHYLLMPLNAKQKAIAGELEQIKKDYNDAVGKTSRLPKLQQEISLLTAEIAEVQKKLPPTKDVPYLIRLLTAKMDRHQIEWKNLLMPGPQLVKEYYIEHSYTIPFKTSYHSLAMFLSDIGQMERIFATRFSSLRSEPNAAGGVILSGELTFLIYTSK